LIRPAWTAAVQIDESVVYALLPQTLPGVPPAGQVYAKRWPTALRCSVALVDHVALTAGGPCLHAAPSAAAVVAMKMSVRPDDRGAMLPSFEMCGLSERMDSFLRATCARARALPP
jgi:hypothetical protein